MTDDAASPKSYANGAPGREAPRSQPNALLPCPFCGAIPEIEFWLGGGPNRRVISCQEFSCAVAPYVTGSTPADAVRKWNRRQP